MNRVRIKLPESFRFTTEIPIRITDLNYGAHLGHDAILPITHEARVRFLNSLGYSELDIEGISYLMADAAIVYKSEGFYGQTLKIDIAVSDFTRNGCDFIYLITDRDTQIEVARVKTGMVFFDNKMKKIVAVPEPFRQAVSG